MNLLELLLEKAKKSELAHFYLIEPSRTNQHEELVQFVHEFIKTYYQKQEGARQEMANLMDHPDVFVLGNTTLEGEEKAFKVEEAEALSRFFEYKPIQGKRKFAVITEAHRITTVVANKWLKLFEEPYGESTIFLLNPRRIELLPTIHSRAIHLKLAAKPEVIDLTEWDEFLATAKMMNLAEFLETFSRGDRELSHWVNQLINWEAGREENAKSKTDLKTWLSQYQEMEIFHQLTATKWSLFYSYLKRNVFERI